jgi:pyruvate dehydrogenase E1 component alpha subunit
MTNRDPLQTLVGRLVEQRLADQAVFDRIQADVQSEIAKGVQYALDAPFPKPEQVDEDVYA